MTRFSCHRFRAGAAGSGRQLHCLSPQSIKKRAQVIDGPQRKG